MTAIALAIVGLFAVWIIRVYCKPLYQARFYGTETDAVISRIERQVLSYRSDQSVVYFCYVLYRSPDGLESEARLLNPKKRLLSGSRVRIRYLPERPDLAVLLRNPGV